MDLDFTSNDFLLEHGLGTEFDDLCILRGNSAEELCENAMDFDTPWTNDEYSMDSEINVAEVESPLSC